MLLSLQNFLFGEKKLKNIQKFSYRLHPAYFVRNMFIKNTTPNCPKKIRNSQETSSPENIVFEPKLDLYSINKNVRVNYIYSSVKTMHQAIQNKPKLRNLIGLVEINKANTIGSLEIFTGIFRYFLPSPPDKFIESSQLMFN